MTYTVLLNIDPFKNSISKNYIHFYHHQPHYKSLKVSGQFSSWKFIISSECFPRSDRLTLFIFVKMSAKCPSLNNHSLHIILSIKKWCFLSEKKKHNNWLVQLMTRSHKWFSSSKNFNSICIAEALSIYFPFYHTEYWNNPISKD